MKPVVIVKTGEPSPAVMERLGTFEEWILRDMALDQGNAEVVTVFHGAELPPPNSIAGAVVTGSAAMVPELHPWSERTASWLRRLVASGSPVLGICYGHQLLAHALGGRVDNNPRGREIGTVRVRLLPAAKTDPLFSGMPNELTVQATHLQSVLELPVDAVPLGESADDPHHAFRFGSCAWGVQFHPEFNARIMRTYLAERHDLLVREGLDPEELATRVEDPGHGTQLLQVFARIVGLPIASATA
jgi:GMP synthase (glutamine-hydrolysing)